MKHLIFTILGVVFVLGIFWSYDWYMGKVAPSKIDTTKIEAEESVAYFAGGCFWCVESDYEKLPSVKEVISGYMGGNEESPSYNQVASGATQHRESVKVVYDPSKTSYRELVLHLLRHSDPTDGEGSFFDRGNQYTSAIYYQTEEEKKIAEDVIKEIDERKVFEKPIVTSVEQAGTFWLAEDYHQDYYKENPVRYGYYREGSGRDKFIESVWGDVKGESLSEGDQENNKWESFEKPNDEILKETLTPIQYKITQKDGTEPAFQNKYYDNHAEGIYVDIVSGEPLFSSTDKFDSGTGWPSFLKPIDKSFVTEKQDFKLFIPRTEIRSKYADSHLGHIILDGPISNDKVRYCMNSAALKFIPKENILEEGYGDFLYLFDI